MTDDLIDRVRSVLDDAEVAFAGTPGIVDLARARTRLDGPLRVAIAGKVKAGKSTLLNALIGERLAPTDTGECTRIVTWYQAGAEARVVLHPGDDSPAYQARFGRDDGAIEIDLGGADSATVDRLVINWPSPSLRRLTLIDTPGVDTLSEGVGERVYEFMDPTESETPADAVLYLMKHMHSSDLGLLDAFHDESVSQPNPINAIAVLSRADEIGAGRIDAMGSAKRIASRYSDDAKLRRLVQMVLPMAGLLAETAQTLTDDEYRMLVALGEVPRADVEGLLLSVDRFVSADPETPLTEGERAHLLDRLGVFGIRQSLALIRSRNVSSREELAAELSKRSGLDDLRAVLTSLFLGRATVLKARSALLTVERLCERNEANPGAADLLLAIERIMAGAHQFAELSTLAMLRRGRLLGPEDELRAMERVLGSMGTATRQRLDLPETADESTVLSAAYAALGHWQRQAESPLTTHEVAQAARVAIRSLEEIVASSTREA